MNYALDLSLRVERILEELQAQSHSSQTNSFAADSNIFTPPNPPFHRNSVSTNFSNSSGAHTDAGSITSVQGQSPGTYGLQYIGKDGDDQSFIPPFVIPAAPGNVSMPGTPRIGMPSTPRTSIPGSLTPQEAPTLATTHIDDLEERALQMAMEEGGCSFLTDYTHH